MHNQSELASWSLARDPDRQAVSNHELSTEYNEREIGNGWQVE